MGDDDGAPPQGIGTYEGGRAEPNAELAHTYGKREGFGTATFPNGDVYEGDYVNGMRHGKGTYYFGGKESPKATYTGAYVENVKTGKGTMLYPDKTKVNSATATLVW